MEKCRDRVGLKAIFIALWLLLAGAVWAQDSDELLVRIDGEAAVSKSELDMAVYLAARQRFFHGQVDDERLQALRAEVLGGLIDRVLLLAEARARDIAVPAELEQRHLRQLRRGYDMQAMPADHRREIEAELRRRAAEQALLEQFERSVRAVDLPTEAQLELFYRQNLDKFTTPPRLRLSVILLKVAPSAPVQAWHAAEAEGRQLYQRLAEGASFAELAKLHSGDASAESGGDLGFVHQGMLSQEAQQVVDTLEEGQVSDPVTLLQGVALFRLEQRQEAKINPLAQVRERAQGLWQRHQAEQAWQGLLASLRAKAKIEIMNSNLTATMIWAPGENAVQ